MSEPPAPSPRFSDLLFRIESTPVYQLTDIETRLLTIARELFSGLLITVRIEDSPGCADLGRTTPAQSVRAAALAFAAAVEIEKPLRDIRDALGSGR